MAWCPTKTGRGILRSSLKGLHPYQHHRQAIPEANNGDLLVFGYASKLFPPDEHSRVIFLGQHLIPWKGDENQQLMIDRYDARASLDDLAEFDGDSWNTHYEVSEEESRIEQLCDQERYSSLYAVIAKENVRQEEELKRLQASISESSGANDFKEVGFNYELSEATSQAAQQQNDPDKAKIRRLESRYAAEVELEEKPFTAPVALLVPPGMEVPPTDKMNAIIEKTAFFVSNQGAQMEIVLKAKQAKNAQFLFLHFDHYLNPYYKHVVRRIKEGKYRPGMGDEERKDENSDSSSDGEGDYLHPSLFAGTVAKNRNEEDNVERFKAIQKVDPNHPLAKLIEKGKKANALKQYNMMKSVVENFKPGTGSLEPPQAPQFSKIDSTAALSPVFLENEEEKAEKSPSSNVIVPPPPDIQYMVDSVARKIAEEGDEMECLMRTYNDPTLAFLLPSHELHPYYKFRKTFIQEQLKTKQEFPSAREEAGTLEERLQEGESQCELEKKDNIEKSAPISFSIKPKESAAKKSLLQISNHLHMLGYDSEDDEDKEDLELELEPEKKECCGASEKENGEIKERKPLTKRKFIERSEVSTPVLADQGVALDAHYNESKGSQSTLSVPVSIHPPSNFAVVTPTGTTASIAVFRKKQAERRQKATLFLSMKNKDSSEETKKNSELASISSVASQDIFQLDADENEGSSKNLLEKGSEAISSSEGAEDHFNAPGQASLTMVKVTSVLTLKDLVVAASSQSGATSPVAESKKKRKKNLSPTTRKRSRSSSTEKDALPSSYRKVQGYLSSPTRRLSDNVEMPSAYKIENLHPNFYDNGGHSCTRDVTPSGESSYCSTREHHWHDVDKETLKKKHRSRKSPSHKSKKKHGKHMKNKRKHKKVDKKSVKSRKKKRHSRTVGTEWSSSNEDSMTEEKKVR